jgi:hypothetical protein
MAAESEPTGFRIPLEGTPELEEPRSEQWKLVPASSAPVEPFQQHPPTLPAGTPARHFSQTFGLDPRAAFLFVLVDLLLFGGELATLGALICFAPVVGVVVAYISYKMQRAWFFDTHESALIKALVLGLLTAIPAPVTPLIAVPGGIVGLLELARRKKVSR